MTKHDINQHVYLTVIWFFILMADHPGSKEIKNLYINCALDFMIVCFLSNTNVHVGLLEYVQNFDDCLIKMNMLGYF